jgi:hypothetical protein
VASRPVTMPRALLFTWEYKQVQLSMELINQRASH